MGGAGRMNRRSFLRDGLTVVGVAAGTSCARNSAKPEDVAAQFRHLTPMTTGIAPISSDERQARIERARRVMRDRGLDAMFPETGGSPFYYTRGPWGLPRGPFRGV